MAANDVAASTNEAVHVVTVATRLAEGSAELESFRRLERSCSRIGLPLTVLGEGNEWKGFGTKLRLVLDHLKESPGEAIVVFVDGFDTFFLPSARELFSRFRSFRARMVFGAEIDCWPDAHLSAAYPPPGGPGAPRGDERIGSLRPAPPFRTPFRYLNSGCYMGYAGAIRDALEELAPGQEDDDQRLFTKYFLAHSDIVCLDHRAWLFQNLHGLPPEHLRIESGSRVRLVNRLTMTDPCVLHGNGAGRSTLAKVADRLAALRWP